MNLVRNILTLSLFLAVTAAAAVPFKIPYQGKLTQTDGTPVTGPQPFVFSIFLNASGGAALWSESLTISVTNGLYSVLLGDVSSCDAGTCTGIAPSVFNASEQYLEISVGGVPMTPRQRIGSVPFAMQAHDVSGGTVNASSVTTPVVAANELRNSSGALVIDSTGKYVGPPIVSAGNGIRVSDAGIFSLPVCTDGQILSQQDGGWKCTNLVATTSVFYLCPNLSGCESTCDGQFTSSSTCRRGGTTSTSGNCQGSGQTACQLLGRLYVAP